MTGSVTGSVTGSGPSSYEVGTPAADQLGEVLEVMRTWQRVEAPVQLHPGDVSWHVRGGLEVTLHALRVWRHAGRVVAVGLLDEAELIRLAVAPELIDDEEFVHVLADDLDDPRRGVLGAGRVVAEIAPGGRLRTVLGERGWSVGESWTPLWADVTASGEGVRAGVGAAAREDGGLRVEAVDVADARQVEERVAVQRAAFDRSTFTVEKWAVMAAGPAYTPDLARCLVGYDTDGVAVAAATVWAAGPGRVGLIEPLGVHHDHRGRGFGRGITLACVDALRDLGAAAVCVVTPSANATAVAAYASAGFRLLPERLDLERRDSE